LSLFHLICNNCGEVEFDVIKKYEEPNPPCKVCGQIMDYTAPMPCHTWKAALHTWTAGGSLNRCSSIGVDAGKEQILKLQKEIRSRNENQD